MRLWLPFPDFVLYVQSFLSPLLLIDYTTNIALPLTPTNNSVPTAPVWYTAATAKTKGKAKPAAKAKTPVKSTAAKKLVTKKGSVKKATPKKGGKKSPTAKAAKGKSTVSE